MSKRKPDEYLTTKKFCSQEQNKINIGRFGNMKVKKRNGSLQKVCPDKITIRLENLTFNLNRSHLNLQYIVQKAINGIYDGITTVELDNLTAETAA